MNRLSVCVLVAAATMMCDRAWAQLRVVTYNTNTFDTELGGSNLRTIRPSADIVFRGIGEELVNGIARPADIILLQEQQLPRTTTQNMVDRLNAIYASQGIRYARGFRVGNTTSGDGTGTPNAGEIRQSVIYRTDSVQLIGETSFGDLSGGAISQPRETLLHQFRPVGYGSAADLFIFNAHFEAGSNAEDLAGRETEARQIRNYIDANGLSDRNVIVAGDLNVGSNFESSGQSTFGGRSALQILAADGPGRVLDPLFPGGQEVNFQIYDTGVPNTQFGVDLTRHLTQSPTAVGGVLVGGGIDDRFDFILQSDELLDGDGVASIPGSLRAFGNNGSTGNTQINNGNTIRINGLGSVTTNQVLDALSTASDHLPVVTDFQLPALLEVLLADLTPTTVTQGDVVELEVRIRNAADVLVSIGADELTFDLSTAGDVFGSATGIDAALGGSFSTLITLDTTTLGDRRGTITVNSNAQGVAGNQAIIPLAFRVVAVPEPGSLAVVSAISWALVRRVRRVGSRSCRGRS